MRLIKAAGRLAAGLAAAAAIGTAISAAICSVWIKVARYSVELDGVKSPVRAVCISDLHGREFGKSNERLVAVVREQAPDVIFAVGDMLDGAADKKELERLEALLTELGGLAPVYFAMGNHEQRYMRANEGLPETLKRTGVRVVDDSYEDVEIAGQTLRIGGTMGHGFAFGRSKEEFEASPEYIFLRDFEDTESPKICLAHMPDTFIFNGAYRLWDIDLVISGHTHGGLVRVPFAGGLFAPMQGWFPEYDRGYFRLGEKIQMIISSGLAGYRWIPRINNRPEIVVVDITGRRD